MVFFKKNKEEDYNQVMEQEAEENAVVSRFKRIYQNDYNNKSEVNKKMEDCYNAYTGSLYKKNLPAHVSQELSNFIFSTIETIKPSMLAENPKVLVFPHTEANFEKSIQVQRALDYEFKREKVFKKTIQVIHNGLVYGNGIMMLPWVGDAQNGLGDVKAIPISPFNIFVDSLATDFDDAEHVIYATYKKVDEAVHFCPEKAEQIRRSASTIQDKYLNFTNDSNDSNDNVLYIEAYFRDYSTELDEETQKVKMKYPRGRRVIIIGDVLISDGENPYEDGGFPFRQWKCYEVPGKFWAISEVEMLISPQKVVFDLQNDIIDNANLTSNPIWIIDKNCGVEKGSLNNKKGLVIRKNPGTEVKRDAPPSIPAYVENAIEMFKKDIEMISGVYDVTRGERPAGITAASAIQALNEQSQGRIKLKVQVLEDFLGDVFSLWLKRTQQFWVTSRSIRIMGDETQTQPEQDPNQSQQIQQPQSFPLGNGKTMSFTSVSKDEIDGDYDVEIAAGSTLPINKSARLQQLIQLAQTTAEDGMPMVDRQTVLENADIPNVLEVTKRFNDIKAQQQQAQQQQADQQAQLQEQQLQAEQQKQQVEKQAQVEQQTQQAQIEQQKAESDHQRELEKMQLDSQNKMALQNNQSQLQSNQEGNDSQNELEQLLQAISQMDTDTYEKFVEMHPEVIKLLETLIPNNQQNELGGGDVNNVK